MRLLLADEYGPMLLHLAPVLLGDGVRLFSRPGGSPIRLEGTSVQEAQATDRAALPGAQAGAVVGPGARSCEGGHNPLDTRIPRSAAAGGSRIATTSVKDPDLRGVMARARIELATPRFSVVCSTN